MGIWRCKRQAVGVWECRRQAGGIWRCRGQAVCVWRHRTANCDDPFQTVPGSIPGSCIPAFTGTRNRSAAGALFHSCKQITPNNTCKRKLLQSCCAISTSRLEQEAEYTFIGRGVCPGTTPFPQESFFLSLLGAGTGDFRLVVQKK